MSERPADLRGVVLPRNRNRVDRRQLLAVFLAFAAIPMLALLPITFGILPGW